MTPSIVVAVNMEVLGVWVGGLFTGIGATATGLTLFSQLADRRREQASNVWVKHDAAIPGAIIDENGAVGAVIHNGSDLPIYKVMVTAIAQDGHTLDLSLGPGLVAPGTEWLTQFNADVIGASHALEAFFTDAYDAGGCDFRAVDFSAIGRTNSPGGSRESSFTLGGSPKDWIRTG